MWSQNKTQTCRVEFPSSKAQEARKDPKVALGDELSSAAYANSVELVKSLLDKGAGSFSAKSWNWAPNLQAFWRV